MKRRVRIDTFARGSYALLSQNEFPVRCQPETILLARVLNNDFAVTLQELFRAQNARLNIVCARFGIGHHGAQCNLSQIWSLLHSSIEASTGMLAVNAWCAASSKTSSRSVNL